MRASQPPSAAAPSTPDTKASPKAKHISVPNWILRTTDLIAKEGKGIYARNHFELKFQTLPINECVSALHEHYGFIVAKELKKQPKSLTSDDYIQITKKLNDEKTANPNLVYPKMLIAFLKELYKDPSYDPNTKPEVVACFEHVKTKFLFITEITDLRGELGASAKRAKEMADAKLPPEDKAAKICVELLKKYFDKINADIPKGATAFLTKGYRSFKHGTAVEGIKKITDSATPDAKGLKTISDHLISLWNWKRDDKKFTDAQFVEFLNKDKGESYYRTIGFVLKYIEAWNTQLKVPGLNLPDTIYHLASGENSRVFAREIADQFKPVLGEITEILHPKNTASAAGPGL